MVRKQDIIIAKNYLGEDELDTLNGLVTLFARKCGTAHQEPTRAAHGFWRTNVDAILQLQDKQILYNAGGISNAAMEAHVRELYAQFDTARKHCEAAEEDRKDLEELRELERKVSKKQRKG